MGNRWGRMACAVAAALAVGLAMAPTAAGRTVIAPKAGATLKSSPVSVTLKAPWRMKHVKVRLNGRNLTEEFDRADVSRQGRRTVVVSASHGLRYGPNKLVVRKFTYGGRRIRDKVRFRLARKRPLVGAGRDRRVGVGLSTHFNAAASRAVRKRGSRASSAGRGGGSLGMRWKLIRKPDASEAKLRVPPGRPAAPRIEPDVPGRYVAQLRVRDGGLTSQRDRVVATAYASTPLVPIDTAAEVGGERGVAIGYHPAQEGGAAPNEPDESFIPLGSGNSLQLVVLDRETLELQESWSGPASQASIGELTSRLRDYDDDDLAIVTAWRGDWYEGATGDLVKKDGQGVSLIGARNLFLRQIEAYGLEPPFTDPSAKPYGQLSWVGVPGFDAGDAWEIGAVGDVGLDGFLSPDDNYNYAYVAPRRSSFDLGPDGQSVSMQIGSGPPIEGSLPDGTGGFLVAYLDGLTLEPVQSIAGGSEDYRTRNADGSPNFPQMEAMVDDLELAATSGAPITVAIRSIGAHPLAEMGLQPPDYQGSFDAILAGGLNELAKQVSALGGHGQLIWGMSTEPQQQDGYALLGNNYASSEGLDGEGTAVDVGSQMKPQGRTRLTGLLSRDRASRLVPQMQEDEPFNAPLLDIAVDEPSTWPYSSTPGEIAALKCIGNAQGLGDDPRVAYWLQTISDDVWTQTASAIGAMSPSACSGVDPGDFANVQGTLVQEIKWLVKVHSYLDALSSPFDNAGLSSFADLTTVADEIESDLDPPPSNQAGVDGLGVLADVAAYAEIAEIPGAGMVATTFLLLGDLTTESNDGPPIDWDERVQADADQIGQELAERFERAADSRERLGDIIASDYAKLSTVGSLGQCTPGQSGCLPEWQWTQPQERKAAEAYEFGAYSQIYGGLVPAAYPVVLKVNTNPDSYGGTFVGPQEQVSGVGCDTEQPFYAGDEALAPPQFLRYGVRQVRNTNFLVFAQENFSGNAGPSPEERFIEASKLSQLFAPYDPEDDPESGGGLGVDQYMFMIDNWHVPGPGFSPAVTREQWQGC